MRGLWLDSQLLSCVWQWVDGRWGGISSGDCKLITSRGLLGAGDAWQASAAFVNLEIIECVAGLDGEIRLGRRHCFLCSTILAIISCVTLSNFIWMECLPCPRHLQQHRSFCPD